jgi:hypothetical protein
MTNLKTAVASVAWRNNGTKAPITVMFVQTKERTSMNVHSRLISRGLGVNNTIKQTLLYNYTEEVFNEDFNEFGFTAKDIVNGYRDDSGNVTAHEINLPSEKIFGEPIYISRYETTNTLEAMNDNGEIKSGWSIKTVDGQELTHEGALIYSTFIFSKNGVDHKIQHDQDLRKVKSVEGISENSKVTSKVEANVEANVETTQAPF